MTIVHEQKYQSQDVSIGGILLAPEISWITNEAVMTEIKEDRPTLRKGHVVLKMRDLEKAKSFYRDILGLKITEERKGFGVFFRFEEYHHDIAVFKVDDDAPAPAENQVGLSHLALVTDNLDAVKAMYARLVAHDVPIVRTVDHGVTKSVYFKDPEGNELEIYCDVPEKPWREVDTIIKADHIDLAT
jgi:catechol 2,3-dioxygenase